MLINKKYFCCCFLVLLICICTSVANAEWCNNDNQVQAEPPELKTFSFAVDLFAYWNASSHSDLELGEKAFALISDYSFFIRLKDLQNYDTSTLRSIITVINILKSNNDLFSDEPLLDRKKAFLGYEVNIKSILQCRRNNLRKLFRNVIKK